MAQPKVSPLADLATPERIEYALDRANAVERRHPLLALIYRVVAEVLTNHEVSEQETEQENAA